MDVTVWYRKYLIISFSVLLSSMSYSLEILSSVPEYCSALYSKEFKSDDIESLGEKIYDYADSENVEYCTNWGEIGVISDSESVVINSDVDPAVWEKILYFKANVNFYSCQECIHPTSSVDSVTVSQDYDFKLDKDGALKTLFSYLNAGTDCLCDFAFTSIVPYDFDGDGYYGSMLVYMSGCPGDVPSQPLSIASAVINTGGKLQRIEIDNSAVIGNLLEDENVYRVGIYPNFRLNQSWSVVGNSIVINDYVEYQHEGYNDYRAIKLYYIFSGKKIVATSYLIDLE